MAKYGSEHGLWKGGREASQKRWNDKASSREKKKKYYRDNRTEISKRNRATSKRLKIEVMTHYSNGELKCARCGIIDIDVLTIDHVYGGGTKQKTMFSGSLGRKLYYWLKTNDYPEGYQVLCFNCNFKKRLEEIK